MGTTSVRQVAGVDQPGRFGLGVAVETTRRPAGSQSTWLASNMPALRCAVKPLRQVAHERQDEPILGARLDRHSYACRKRARSAVASSTGAKIAPAQRIDNPLRHRRKLREGVKAVGVAVVAWSAKAAVTSPQPSMAAGVVGVPICDGHDAQLRDGREPLRDGDVLQGRSFEQLAVEIGQQILPERKLLFQDIRC